MGTAESSTASQAQYAPTNTGAPGISGSTVDGSTLTATTGTWASSSSTTYSFQWQRCNATGAACVNIAGATNQTYVLQTADVNNRIRVVVTARNADGSTVANSAVTAAITAKAPAGTETGTTISAANVNLPDRLVVDQVKFTPNPVRVRGAITARFHIQETQQGKSVSDALVYAIGLPYSRVTVPAEVKTDAQGWATMTFQPAKFFPRKGYITFFVRARKGGDDLLAGVSTRRLVQITVNR
jgi:uncharacterized cupredoxin-like copper-binding protein